MRHLMILTAGICLLLTSVPATADQAEDEAAVKKVVAAIEAAFNDHDPAAVLPLVDDTIVMFGRTIRDRGEAEAFWSEVFAQSKNAKRRFLEEIDIGFQIGLPIVRGEAAHFHVIRMSLPKTHDLSVNYVKRPTAIRKLPVSIVVFFGTVEADNAIHVVLYKEVHQFIGQQGSIGRQVERDG